MSHAESWQHLAAWWAENGARYNLAELARAVGKSKARVWTVLHRPTANPSAPTIRLVDRLSAELQKSYTPARLTTD